MLAPFYRNSLALAAEKELRSIAFPAISTGEAGDVRLFLENQKYTFA
jgi:O-acetyl-ADP-ribose deacetylase (regulator of RNase III)